MFPSETDTLEMVYRTCRSFLDKKTWGRIRAACATGPSPTKFADGLLEQNGSSEIPGFLPDLARLECAFRQLELCRKSIRFSAHSYKVNPTLGLYNVSWKYLGNLIHSHPSTDSRVPEKGDTIVMVWQHPDSNEPDIADAGDQDLLALKLVVDHIDIKEAALNENVSPEIMIRAMEQAVRKGILLGPPSRIRRGFACEANPDRSETELQTATTFTLQWHITQACDLHCRHCYDRTERNSMSLEQGLAVLDDFFDFCTRHHMCGQVTFTGGNPLLYPHFEQLYQAASDRWFTTAILGNPSSKKQLEQLVHILKPAFFQVSLEGLEPYNDWIRGPGHFQRTLEFLNILREFDIYAMVMLTLNRDNIDQVLPLTEALNGRADSFTFNRLAMVGEGASLMLPDRNEYEVFLHRYLNAAQTNPMLALKDNLINIIRYRQGLPLFGGCTGFGCGAAFNFVSVLADGEVHACRKFPSYLGNIFSRSLSSIYHSDLAEHYRMGSLACRSCTLNRLCRGCLASIYSCGGDVFNDPDPHCFMSTDPVPTEMISAAMASKGVDPDSK